MMKTFLTTLTLFISYNLLFSQDLKMCGYQGYQTVDEITTACDLQGATKATASTEAAAQVVDNILDKVGLFRNFLIEQCNDINNAIAVTMPLEDGDLDRYILYDQDFFSKVSASTGTDWGNTSILAHEVGHHLNGHTLKAGGSNHKIELQADEFSGFILARMNCSLQDAQSAVNNLLPDEASATHPAKKDRLLAIEKGWNRGKGKTIKVKTITEAKKELEDNQEEDVTVVKINEENMVQAVLGRYIEAIGGQEKVAQIKTFYKESVEINKNKKGKLISNTEKKQYFLTPSKIYTETNNINTGTIEKSLILNGVVYEEPELSSNNTLRKTKRVDFIAKNSISYVPEYTQLINNVPGKYLGIEKVNGENCHVIEFEKEVPFTNVKSKSTKYFHVENGLLACEIMTGRVHGPLAKFNNKTYYQNYKKVDGVLFPFKQELESEVKLGIAKVRVRVTIDYIKIELNPEIDKTKFIVDED